jgi:hypothetical protein
MYDLLCLGEAEGTGHVHLNVDIRHEVPVFLCVGIELSTPEFTNTRIHQPLALNSGGCSISFVLVCLFYFVSEYWISLWSGEGSKSYLE